MYENNLFDCIPMQKYPVVDDFRIRKSNRPTPVPYGHKAYRVQCVSLSMDFICLASDANHAELFARNFVWDEYGIECFLSITEYNDFFVLK